MKKTLVLLLAALMMLTVSIGVFAEEEDPNDNFSVLTCKRIGDNELLLTFSEEVNSDGIGKPYTAIRWCYVDGNGLLALAWEDNVPLQYAPESWAFFMNEDGSNDYTKIVLTFADGDLEKYMWGDEDGVYTPYLCMEEKNPTDRTEHKHVFDVVSESGKELLCNRPGYNTDWDGVYLPIDPGDYKAPEWAVQTDPPVETEYKPTTEAPVTEAPKATEAPAATEAPKSTDAPAETKAAEKSGCGSVVASLAIVPMLLCAAYVSKKH